MKAETFAPNPYGDQDKGWALISVCWAFVICAFITTCLRVWVRARLTRNLGWDDVVMMTAMGTTLVGAGLITAEAVNGLGRHMFYLTASQRRLFGVIGWADWIQSFITLGLTKISICLFLLRIVESKKLVMGLRALIGVTALFTAVCVFLFIGVCRPLKAYWDVGVSGQCLSNPQIEAVVLAQGVLSILTDLICAALPAIFLRNLQIDKRTKIGLCVLMGLGVITAVCCIVRTALSGAITDPDLTWAISSNVAWRLPEVNIGIVCANAPVLRPLYLFFRGRLQSQRITSATAASKDRIFPNNARNSKPAQSASSTSGMWNHGSEDTTVEMEMGLGLPIHGSSGNQEDDDARRGSQSPVSPVLESPLKEKPFFSLGNGRP